MAKRPSLTDIANISTAATVLNANNDEIETAFDNTLSRDGSTPNQMAADIDMDSNDLLNVNRVSATELFLEGADITDTLDAANAQATASAASAASSASAAGISAADASTAASDAADEVASINVFLPTILDNFNAVGDGVTDDTAAIDSAIATGQQVFLSFGKTYRYVGVPNYSLNTTGPGTIVFEESTNPDQEHGDVVFAGSHKSLGGENRAWRHGGFALADPIERRGMQWHQGDHHAWSFMSERGDFGESCLFTHAPNCKTVNGTVSFATDPDRIVAGTNLFSENWPVDALVMYNNAFYRISAVAGDGSYIDIVNDDGGRTAVAFTADATDNCILPGFVWIVQGSTSGTALTVEDGGDVPPSFTTFDYNNDRVMAKVDGTWYRVSSQIDAFNLTLATSAGTTSGEVLLFLQPRYSMKLALKWTSGGGLEQTFGIETAGDGVRFKSSGSGVGPDKPFIFEVGSTDKFCIEEDRVRVETDFRVTDDSILEKLTVNGNLLTNFIRPESADTEDVGNDSFPYRRVYANEYRVGTTGATQTGATGSFTAQSGETVTVVGGIITSIV